MAYIKKLIEDWILLLSIIFYIALFFGLYFVIVTGEVGCYNEEEYSVTSQNGKYMAVVFFRKCDLFPGDSSPTTNISIMKDKDDLGYFAKGNIYRRIGYTRVDELTVFWRDDNQLIVRLPRCTGYRNLSKDKWGWHDEVSIKYSEGGCYSDW